MRESAYIQGLDEFLEEQSFISIRPAGGNHLLLEGDFLFCAEYAGHPVISDTYQLKITIPEKFPQAIPAVVETGGRIPRLADFHVNADGTLCLGSRIRLMARLQAQPSIQEFSSNCLVPYLYAMSLRLIHKTPFIFGELSHGVTGEIDDCRDLLGLNENTQVIPALRCMLKRKRLANKMVCPCGCRRRLGKCRKTNSVITKYRRLLPKSWLREVVTGKR